MKPMYQIFYFLMLPLVFTSCGKPPDDSEPQREEIIYPDPVPDYDIEIRNPQPPVRVNPDTVPLPPPEPEVIEVEPRYVMTSHRCFEGNPQSNLKHTKSIKYEMHGLFRRKSIWVYSCQGTSGCEKMLALRKTTHAAFELRQHCLEAITDQDLFSICREEKPLRISTYRGDMLQFEGAVNRTPVTIYCETSLPL